METDEIEEQEEENLNKQSRIDPAEKWIKILLDFFGALKGGQDYRDALKNDVQAKGTTAEDDRVKIFGSGCNRKTLEKYKCSYFVITKGHLQDNAWFPYELYVCNPIIFENGLFQRVEEELRLTEDNDEDIDNRMHGGFRTEKHRKRHIICRTRYNNINSHSVAMDLIRKFGTPLSIDNPDLARQQYYEFIKQNPILARPVVKMKAPSLLEMCD